MSEHRFPEAPADVMRQRKISWRWFVLYLVPAAFIASHLRVAVGPPPGQFSPALLILATLVGTVMLAGGLVSLGQVLARSPRMRLDWAYLLLFVSATAGPLVSIPGVLAHALSGSLVARCAPAGLWALKGVCVLLGLHLARWVVSALVAAFRRGGVWSDLAPYAMLAMLVGTLGTLLVSLNLYHERTIYIWDSSGYWNWSIDLAETMRTNPALALRQVSHPIQVQYYTPVLGLLPLTYWFGPSRLGYELAIVWLYAVPAVVLSAVLVGRLLRRPGETGRPVLAAALALLWLPGFWVPTFNGMPDVGGVSLMLGGLAYFRPRTTWRPTVHLAGPAACLVLAWLFRRWYAFAVVAVLATAFIEAAVMAMRHRSWRWGAVRYFFARPVLLGALTALLGIAFFGPLIKYVLGHDYLSEYGAYKRLTAWGDLLGTVHRVGWGPAAVLAAAAIWLVVDRAARHVALLLCLQLILIFLLFERVQNHSWHHYLLYYPCLLPLLAGFFWRTTDRLRAGWARAALTAVVASAGLACTIGSFQPAWGARLPSVLAAALPRDQLAHERRDDLLEMERLSRFLDAKVRQAPGLTCYVLSSTPTFCEDDLRNLEISLGLPDIPHKPGFPRKDYIVPTAHVDRRDGFPRGLLSADLVLLAKPIQTHLDPANQQVVVLPARSFLGGLNIAKAFEKLPEEFHLDHGVVVYVYRKLRPIDSGEIDELESLLRGAYPDEPGIWSAGR